MTTKPQTLELQPQPDTFDHPPALPQPTQDPAPPGLALYTHRGNGNVAHLPKAVRDQVNIMLADGLPYTQIIRCLGDHGKHLKPSHIGEWKKRGHKEWLQQQEWLDHLFSKSEFSGDVLASPQNSDLHEAGLRIAAAQMLDQLARFAADPSPQSERFARLVNALSRLTREALSFRKYHDAADLHRAQQLKQLPADRDLIDNDHDLFLSKAEQFFGRKLPKLQPPPTPAPPTNHPPIYDPPEPDSP